MWLVSLGAGALAAGRGHFLLVLLLATSFLVLWLRAILFRLLRGGVNFTPQRREKLVREALVIGGLLALSLPFLIKLRPLLLIPGAAAVLFLAFDLWFVRRRQERTVWGELSGVAGLTLSAPAAYYVAGGSHTVAWLLWLLLLAYFGCGVPYIKMHTARRVRKTPRNYALAALLSSALAFMGVLWGSWQGYLSVILVPVFGLALLRPLIAWALPATSRNIRAVGWSEVLLSAVFGVAVGLSL